MGSSAVTAGMTVTLLVCLLCIGQLGWKMTQNSEVIKKLQARAISAKDGLLHDTMLTTEDAEKVQALQYELSLEKSKLEEEINTYRMQTARAKDEFEKKREELAHDRQIIAAQQAEIR